MRKNLFFGGCLIAVALTLSALAEGTPMVGEKAPDFSLQGIDGQKIKLSEVNASSQVVLIVLRGWPGYQCPICTSQVHEFVSVAPQIKEKGAKVLMVYPGPAESLKAHAEEFLKDKSWPKEFVLALDPDYSMVKAYGLRWNEPNETAYPSTFILDPKGTVRFAKVSHGHGDRSRGAEVLKVIDTAASK